MADDESTLDPKMVELVRQAIARGVPRLGHEEPLDKPPILSGRDAAVIREIARQIVDERLRERRLLSDMEIQSVAKDISQAIFDQSIRNIKQDIRTQEEIEEIIVDKLREAGIRADDEHIDETRQTLEGLQRGHKRRAEIGADFVREMLKALAGWIAVGSGAAIVTYLAMKGGSH